MSRRACRAAVPYESGVHRQDTDVWEYRSGTGQLMQSSTLTATHYIPKRGYEMRKFLILMSLASGLLACADGSESDASDQQVLSQAAEAVKPVLENLAGPCKADADCKGTGTRCITKSQI